MTDNRTLNRVASIKNLVFRNRRKREIVDFVASKHPERLSTVKHVQPRLEIKLPDKDATIQITTVELSDSSSESSPTKHAPQWPVTWQENRPNSYIFETPPKLIKTLWEHRPRRRPATLSTSSEESAFSTNRLDKLPRDIMHHIVFNLKEIHCSDGEVIVQDLRNDLCALSKTSRRWHRIASEHLYDEIWLPSNEDPRGRRMSFAKPQSQLRCLRRTLEENPRFSLAVRQLRIPYSLSKEILDQSSPASVRHSKDTVELIAEVISQCPSLELFTGFYTPDCSDNAGIWNALSSRPMLKSHCWALDPEWNLNTRNIVDYHMNWQNLETLAISDTILGTGTLFGILWFLPALKHLMLRRLSGSGVHCGTLMMLPALTSLRLEALQDIDDGGLERLPSPKIANSLERLTLVDMDVKSLSTIQKLMADLTQLKMFALKQISPPELDVNSDRRDSGMEFLLYSQTIQELCWRTSSSVPALSVIASSITAGYFPALRKLRTPGDSVGIIQGCLAGTQETVSEEPLSDTWIEVQLRSIANTFGAHMGGITSNIQYLLDSGKPGKSPAVADFGSVIVPEGRGVQDRLLDMHSLF